MKNNQNIQNDFEFLEKNQSNGWQQYQIYVLNQLKDHSMLLQKLTEKNNEQQLLLTMIQKELNALNNENDELLQQIIRIDQSINEFNNKIINVENYNKINEQVKSKTKAYWATIGASLSAGILFIIQIIEKTLNMFFTNK